MKVEDISAKSGDERSQIGEKDIEVQQSIETSPDVDTYSQDKEISNTSPGAEIILKNRESKKKFRGSPQEKKTGSDTKLKNHRQGNQQAKNSGEKAPNKGDPGNGEPIHRHGTRQQTGHLKHGNRENDRLLNDVTKDMAHLQVQSSENTRGAFLKRNKETLTIEGSPLVKVKRRDMRPTPVAFREVGGSRSNNTATVESNPERNSSRRIVQVLSFQSQDHDTKDHQENVRRTVLLTGPKGCLRRPEINQFIQWIDESHVPPIQLSDLLR